MAVDVDQQRDIGKLWGAIRKLEAYVQALCDLPEGIDPEHEEWPSKP